MSVEHITVIHHQCFATAWYCGIDMCLQFTKFSYILADCRVLSQHPIYDVNWWRWNQSLTLGIVETQIYHLPSIHLAMSSLPSREAATSSIYQRRRKQGLYAPLTSHLSPLTSHKTYPTLCFSIYSCTCSISQIASAASAIWFTVCKDIPLLLMLSR